MNRLCMKIGVAIGLVAGSLQAQNDVHGELIEFNDNGAWCWYQDERAIIDNGKIILATIAHSSGSGGNSRHGNMEITTYDLVEKTSSRNVLYDIGADDHNVAALLKRPDNRYIAVYATHGNTNDMYWNISEPNNSTQWGQTQRTSVGAGNTYSNLFRLEDEGRTYNFHRGRGWNPNAMVSDDDGDSWSYGGRLIEDSGRPYLKYTSNNKDIIHFINTEQHPRDFNNSIYHGYIRDGKTYNSNGDVIDNNFFDGSGPRANMFTKIYPGGTNNVGWTSDIHLDSNENPYIAFSVQMNRSQNDLRYHYGRWDGSQWHHYEIAYAGTALYNAEQDYTGNIALDPDDPNIVYISTDADPVTGDPLISQGDNRRHYEMFKGTTENQGEDWEWTPITENSTMDNIRPVVPKWSKDSTALLWMRGSYSTYTNWNADLVGVLLIDSIADTTTMAQLGDISPDISSFSQGVLSFTPAQPMTVKIINIRGEILAENRAVGPFKWDLSSLSLSGGLYLVQTRIGARKLSQKIYLH